MADNNAGVGSGVIGQGTGITSSSLVTTWANKPPAGFAGRTAFFTNAGTKGSMWVDDGTRWKLLNNQTILTTLDSSSGNISNSATIVLQYLIPAGMWQVGDVIRLQATMEKSGTTDTGITTAYIGTAGTTSDTTVLSATWAVAATISLDSFIDIRLDAATTAQIVSLNTGYGATTGNQLVSYTISSAATNNLYVSLAIRSSGTTNTVLSRYGAVYLKSKGT